MLDVQVCGSITSLIEQLSTSGKEEVDMKVFKDLVGFAGQSEEYLKFTLERIFHHLEQKHSEIRLGAFLIVEQLFKRSHYFREILLDQFHTFLELTVESNQAKLLPPPYSVAKVLKHKVLQAVHKWYLTFGKEHKRLALSYNFLKNNLKVDFQDALKRNAAELQALRVEQERQAKMMEKKVKEVEAEVTEHQDEIARVVTEMDNCFCLLVPKPEEVFGDQSEGKQLENKQDIDIREHGFYRASATSVNITGNDLRNIQETEDNVALIENLRDFHALLKNRYLPMIKKWVVVASKAVDQSLFRKVMDMKNMVEQEISRYGLIQVSKKKDSSEDSSDSDEDDSDFEEVEEKEGFETEVVAPPVAVAASSSITSTTLPSTSKGLYSTGWSLLDVRKEDAEDPTTLTATLRRLNEDRRKKLAEAEASSSTVVSATSCRMETVTRPSCSQTQSETMEIDNGKSRKERLLKLAPKLPYDIDLYHWEDKDLQPPTVEIVETDGHKFWTPSQDRAGEVISDPSGIESLRSRVIEFSGKFEPVKWSCRAPLPSGTLCPRRDRFKCPLHGKIIPRDNMGNPTNPEDVLALEKAKEEQAKNKPPEWQDPEFLKEIEAATGMDLTIRPPKKGKKKKKTFSEMYPNLTDIEKKRNTPRTRLEKKVFNKGAMQRVADTLDELSSKRFRDKYGDQWNYFMNDD